MMDLQRLHAILNSLWVVWFFLLFIGMLAWVLRPSKRDHYRRLAEIPFQDDPAEPRRSGGGF